MSTEEQSRAEFEAHMRKLAPTYVDELLFGKTKRGNYASMITEFCWKTWQARAPSQQAVVFNPELLTSVDLSKFDMKPGKIVMAPPAATARVGLSEDLHTFLDAAAGEGLILGGIDAADLYIATFPERYAAAAHGIPVHTDKG